MILAALALLQAAEPPPAPPVPARQEGVMIIELRRADESVAARAMVWPGRAGVEVRIQAANLVQGQYAAHIHAVGRCEGPRFESAGAHWNPTARQHGRLNPAGRHLGDLDNLEVSAEREGRLEFTIPGATLAGSGEGAIIDADGAAIVLHAFPDDYRTDPHGNSGARIACGVLRAEP
jgi:Cu-Zn family superoxide dismutase